MKIRTLGIALCFGLTALATASSFAADRSAAKQSCTPCIDTVTGTSVVCKDSKIGCRSDDGRTYMEFLPPSSERAGSYGSSFAGSSLQVTPVKSSGSTQTPTLPAAAPSVPPRIVVRIGDTLTGALFTSGSDRLLPDAVKRLDDLAVQLRNKRNIRLEAVGHTDNLRIRQRKTMGRFGTNQALSEARARAVAHYLQKGLALPDTAVGIVGKGESQPIADNAAAAGRARNRRAEIAFWYDDEKPNPDYITPGKVTPPVALAPPPPPLCGESGPADRNDLPFRITVDGQPVEPDTLKPEADRQRCVDVALAKNDIQVRYDPMQTKPALNTWSHPDGIVRGKEAEFGVYCNYLTWIAQAEIRVFSGNHPEGKPLAVLPVRWDAAAVWTPPADAPEEMTFLLRVYDRKGRFDETASKPLRLLDKSRPSKDIEKPEGERLTGWGQDSRALANIPVSGGTVTVNGKNIRPGQSVRVLDIAVPVDKNGAFAVRQIYPAGPYTVKVEVTEPDGGRASFSRNLTIADQDWFYIAMADITVGQNHTTGPAPLVTTDTRHYDGQTYVDGRGAFYLKGKIKGEYLLTASADTTELPVQDLFRNFTSKDPRYLLKRIDPDRYYPVYGDDSTLVEDAPTQGKFYVRIDRGDSHILWGNFQTQWTGNELTQYSRALYGGELLLKTPSITRYGERRAGLNAFAAEPGTLQSRDDFRATGGSLYYLRHLDITQGSERVWTEVRDKDSGMVLERTQLVPAQDYDLNSIQGRIMLRAPLPSVTGGSGMIVTGSVPGNPVYLVATYEYVPGVTAVDGYAYGFNGFWWVTDYLRLGLTGFKQGENEQKQELGGVDLTLRYTPESYVKAEVARSRGPGAGQENSITGGFEFIGTTTAGERADAKRVEAQVNFADFFPGIPGKARFYWQDRDRGFSGPGELTPGEKVTQLGGRLTMPIGKTVETDIKGDDRLSPTQSARSVEGSVRWQFLPQWQLGLAVRSDDRRTTFANASYTLSENGERTDVQVRLHYKPLLDQPGNTPPRPAGWDLYSFLQGTVSRSGTRHDNDRIGLGGGWQVSDRLRLTGEVSGGDGGVGGLLGGDYRVNDRSNVYLTYTMETERPDSNLRGRYGTAVIGTKYRISDQMAIYGETKSVHGAGPESLVNAFGLDLAPNDRWTYGIKSEWGVVNDPLAGDLRRQAVGLSAAYKKDLVKYAGNLEYRHENGTAGERHVWLMRNSLSYQVQKDWRLFAKANFSFSKNSNSTFFDGDFVEMVAGGAYRPVNNDRLNALIKYTYFQDTPTAGQLTASNLVSDYSQRSHVVSADVIYDLLPYLSLGGKVGYRCGLLKPNKIAGGWFTSQALLGVARADLHIIRKWDLVGELRTLIATEAKDQRSGALAAVYYHVAKSMKVGVGYNFTDFSDDLTDLSYHSNGWFFNVMATF
jgi:outer membrane protein OmpA-like peptidoglycan-associated protein